MGLLSAGSIAGPGIGALAATVGSGFAFGLVAAVSFVGVVLAVLAPTGRAVAAGESRLWASIARGARQPATIAAMAMSLIDLCAFGAVDLLVPLGLGRSGTSVERDRGLLRRRRRAGRRGRSRSPAAWSIASVPRPWDWWSASA